MNIRKKLAKRMGNLILAFKEYESTVDNLYKRLNKFEDTFVDYVFENVENSDKLVSIIEKLKAYKLKEEKTIKTLEKLK